jgi:hypothetical protein
MAPAAVRSTPTAAKLIMHAFTMMKANRVKKGALMSSLVDMPARMAPPFLGILSYVRCTVSLWPSASADRTGALTG